MYRNGEMHSLLQLHCLNMMLSVQQHYYLNKGSVSDEILDTHWCIKMYEGIDDGLVEWMDRRTDG